MDEDEERTLLIIKPDAVQRGLYKSIVKVWNRKGYELILCRQAKETREQMEAHYCEHAGRPYFDALIDRMLDGECVVMIWKGRGIIKWSRAMLGATDPINAEPWTIRGMYATCREYNVLHASDSVESAKREILVWSAYLICL